MSPAVGGCPPSIPQTLPDWTGAHVRMFRFFGGAPKLLVPDNLKSGAVPSSRG
jgi:transposase